MEEPVQPQSVAEAEEEYIVGDDEQPVAAGSDDTLAPPRKFYVDGGHVEIAAHLVYDPDPDGKQLQVVEYTDYTAETVRSLYPNASELRKKWADPTGRHEIIETLAARGIDFEELAEASKQPDADPFDLLCHVAFNAPLRTRRERAERLRSDRKDFFDQYRPDARHGNVVEIANKFGGVEPLRAAVAKMQTLLHAA